MQLELHSEVLQNAKVIRLGKLELSRFKAVLTCLILCQCWGIVIDRDLHLTISLCHLLLTRLLLRLKKKPSAFKSKSGRYSVLWPDYIIKPYNYMEMYTWGNTGIQWCTVSALVKRLLILRFLSVLSNKDDALTPTIYLNYQLFCKEIK